MTQIVLIAVVAFFAGFLLASILCGYVLTKRNAALDLTRNHLAAEKAETENLALTNRGLRRQRDTALTELADLKARALFRNDKGQICSLRAVA